MSDLPPVGQRRRRRQIPRNVEAALPQTPAAEPIPPVSATEPVPPVPEQTPLPVIVDKPPSQPQSRRASNQSKQSTVPSVHHLTPDDLLAEVSEDVVAEVQGDANYNRSNSRNQNFGPGQQHGGAGDQKRPVFFVQHGQKFQKITEKGLIEMENQRLKEANARDEQVDVAKKAAESLYLGIQVQTGLRWLSTFGSGMLAGMAFWQVIILRILLDNFGDEAVVQLLKPIMLPLSCIYFLLIVICLIHSLDRGDIAGLNVVTLKAAFGCHNTAVYLAMIYYVGLILTVILFTYDEKLHDLPMKQLLESDILEVWFYLNVGRAVPCILGWLLISWKCDFHLLLDRLRSELTSYNERHSGSQNNAEQINDGNAHHLIQPGANIIEQ